MKNSNDTIGNRTQWPQYIKHISNPVKYDWLQTKTQMKMLWGGIPCWQIYKSYHRVELMCGMKQRGFISQLTVGLWNLKRNFYGKAKNTWHHLCCKKCFKMLVSNLLSFSFCTCVSPSSPIFKRHFWLYPSWFI